MPFDKDYWSRLATEAGLPKEQVEAIAGNEKLMTAFVAGYKRQDEFSRDMDASRKTKADAEAAQQVAITKYNENLTWFESNKHLLTKAEQADALSRQVQAYQALYGELGNPNPAPAPAPANGNGNGQPKYLTAEDLATGQRNIWTLVKQMEQAKEQYENHFGKRMPVAVINELEAAAMKPENLNRAVPDLFNEHIAPKLEEHRATQQKEREDRIRKEAYDQGMAKGRINEPSIDNPDNVAPFYATRPADQKAPDERQLMSNFIAALEQPPPA